MPPKPPKRPRPARVSLHVSLSPDVAAKVRAYAGWHGLEISAVVERALRAELKGFGVRQDPPAAAARPEGAGGAGEGLGAA